MISFARRALLFLACVLLAGCYSLMAAAISQSGTTSSGSNMTEYNAYVQAGNTNTIESWESYLSKYPDSPRAGGAKNRLADLYESKASQENTIESWQYIIDRFPDRTDNARRHIEEINLASAKKKNTIAAYKAFADSSHTDLRDDADKLAFDVATSIGSEASYQEYLDSFPRGSYTASANNRLQDLKESQVREQEQSAFKEASSKGTVAAFKSFLEVYPAGELADQARAQIYSVASSLEIDALRKELAGQGWPKSLLDSVIDYGSLYEGSQRQHLIGFLYGVTGNKGYLSMSQSYNSSERTLRISIKFDVLTMDVQFRETTSGLLPRRVSTGEKEDLGNAAATSLFLFDSQLSADRYMEVMSENGIAGNQ